MQPSHPFIQDPTMPPNPAPNPLTQLEEARRRLEEEKIKSGALQPKQRWVALCGGRNASHNHCSFPTETDLTRINEGRSRTRTGRIHFCLSKNVSVAHLPACFLVCV